MDGAAVACDVSEQSEGLLENFGRTESQLDGDLPRLVIFVVNVSGVPLQLQSVWLGGDASWNGDAVDIIQHRQSLCFVAQREMAGIVCYECAGETVAVGFQSEKCPIIDDIEHGVPSRLFNEWLEIHRKQPEKSFVALLGGGTMDVSLKTLGEGVSMVAKMRIGLKVPVNDMVSTPMSTHGTREDAPSSPSSSSPEIAQSYSDDDFLAPNKHAMTHAKEGKERKRDKLLKPFSVFRKKGKQPSLPTDAPEPSHPSTEPSQHLRKPDKAKFFDKAKAILSFNSDSGDSVLQQVEENHELGRARRALAKEVFQQCLRIPINVDRLKNWTNRQKFAFGQMVVMCLSKLHRRDVGRLGDYPEIRSILGKALVQRHMEVLAVLLGVISMQEDLAESVSQQYMIMHQGGHEEIPDASIFLEAVEVEEELDKYCLLRDLTALLIAAGSFDTRVLEFLKLMAADISVVPEAIDEWASDSGKNLWEAYQSQKGEKESGVAAWKIAAGIVVGGLALGVTGGLALATVPAALGAVGSALTGGVTATASIVGLPAAGSMAATALTGIFASTAAFFAAVGPAGGALVFGATGMGLTGYKLVNRWGDLSNFDFVPIRPESRVSSMRVWKDAVVERIDLIMEDESTITYGSCSDWVQSRSIVFAANERMVGVCGTAIESPDDSGLCSSLKIKTNLDRTKHFSGSAYKTMKNKAKSFCYVAKDDHAIVGFDFNHGNCIRVYSSSGSKPNDGTGAVNWTLFVSGWVINRSDFRVPWMKVHKFFSESDHFCLEWENENVIRLGHFLGDRIRSEIGDFAARAWVKSTVVAVGGGIIVWPWFVTKSLVDLDNDWILVMERAKLAGRCLATVLADSQEIGNRPVTLCGHSMGSVVIFNCLLELYELQKFHVVKDVILLGSPIPLNSTSVSLDTEIWARARAVVGGRLVNGYSGSDWLLAFLFRYMEWRLFVAGLQPVDGVPGIENVDLSPIVNSHEDYLKKCDMIMHYIGFY